MMWDLVFISDSAPIHRHRLVHPGALVLVLVIVVGLFSSAKLFLNIDNWDLIIALAGADELFAALCDQALRFSDRICLDQASSELLNSQHPLLIGASFGGAFERMVDLFLAPVRSVGQAPRVDLVVDSRVGASLLRSI